MLNSLGKCKIVYDRGAWGTHGYTYGGVRSLKKVYLELKIMNFKVKGGVYPTMITPYKNGQIDYEACDKLVEWYWNAGCDGIFAACQSSEIMFLSIEERTLLVRLVVDESKKLAEADKSKEYGQLIYQCL